MTDNPDLDGLPPPTGAPNESAASDDYLPQVNWSYGQIAIALLFGIIVGPFIGLAIYAVLNGQATEDVPTLFLLTSQVIASFGVLIFLSMRRGTGDWRTDFGFAIELRHFWWIAGGMVLQIGVALLTFPLVDRFAQDDGPQQEIARIATDLSGTELLIFGVIVAIFTPIFEEVVFRGMLLGRLVKSMSRRWAAVVSAGAFAAIHLADPNAYLVVPGLFIVGLALAYVAYRSKNLSIPILVHIGVNSLAVFFLAFADELEDAAEAVESLIRLTI
ncbi:MAG: CPBP family intramembrane metalloprotease [Acidimicrobiia bacterium]|nr:CPBP family intramembrane metalloprotease [Acidimicrobiia bacterium]